MTSIDIMLFVASIKKLNKKVLITTIIDMCLGIIAIFIVQFIWSALIATLMSGLIVVIGFVKFKKIIPELEQLKPKFTKEVEVVLAYSKLYNRNSIILTSLDIVCGVFAILLLGEFIQNMLFAMTFTLSTIIKNTVIVSKGVNIAVQAKKLSNSRKMLGILAVSYISSRKNHYLGGVSMRATIIKGLRYIFVTNKKTIIAGFGGITLFIVNNMANGVMTSWAYQYVADPLIIDGAFNALCALIVGTGVLGKGIESSAQRQDRLAELAINKEALAKLEKENADKKSEALKNAKTLILEDKELERQKKLEALIAQRQQMENDIRELSVIDNRELSDVENIK